MEQSSFGILKHNYVRTHNLVLVAHAPKYIKFKWIKVGSVDFKKMLINFRKKATMALFLLFL